MYGTLAQDLTSAMYVCMYVCMYVYDLTGSMHDAREYVCMYVCI